MAAITKDERQVNRAQRLYDSGVDQYLDIIEELNTEIPHIYDILQGVALGKPEPKYQISSSQYGALKDQFHLWKANVQNPEKILANINSELKKRYSKQKNPTQQSSSKPTIKKFSPTAV